MADTPVQTFGPLPDTLTFGPFGPDGDIIIHIENLVLGCPPFVQNIGVPFVCDAEETANIEFSSPVVFGTETSTNKYSIGGVVYPTSSYPEVDPGTYCFWSSDAGGAINGDITLLYVGGDGSGSASIDVSRLSALVVISLQGLPISEIDLSVNIGIEQCIIYNASSMSGIDLSNNTGLHLIDIQNMALLADVSLSTLTECSTARFSGCALTQASVDLILVTVAANGLNTTVDLGGGTSSAPSATGLAAKATIEGNGGTVTVNP